MTKTVWCQRGWLTHELRSSREDRARRASPGEGTSFGEESRRRRRFDGARRPPCAQTSSASTRSRSSCSEETYSQISSPVTPPKPNLITCYNKRKLMLTCPEICSFSPAIYSCKIIEHNVPSFFFLISSSTVIHHFLKKMCLSCRISHGFHAISSTAICLFVEFFYASQLV